MEIQQHGRRGRETEPVALEEASAAVGPGVGPRHHRVALAEASQVLGNTADEFRDEIELVKGACPELSIDAYLAAKQTPVFFGSAISNFGVRELLASPYDLSVR